jgi:hypothetical protein
MERITDLIFQEFEKAGYRSKDGILWKHQTYMDYWVVACADGRYELRELQDEIYENLAEEREREPEMEKNTSLLIINLVDEAGKNRQRIIEDENDVYVYKKYVIQYTQQEWDYLKGLIEREGVPYNDLLMRADLFEMMRVDHNGNLSLLYTIAHKLPFVTMAVTKKDYEISEDVHVQADLEGLLSLVDSIAAPERKTVSEGEINAVKDVISSMINEEIAIQNENRANTPT